MKGFFI